MVYSKKFKKCGSKLYWYFKILISYIEWENIVMNQASEIRFWQPKINAIKRMNNS